jgi:hypothetical protein
LPGFLLVSGIRAAEPSSAPRDTTPWIAISVAELRADLSFLASDALEGRYTPSPGLEVAAEFIASRFREAGLKPGGDHDYFQTAHMTDRIMPKAAARMIVKDSGQTFTIAPDSLQIVNTTDAAHIEDAPVLVVPKMDPQVLTGVDLAGKVILVPLPDFRKMPHQQAIATYSSMQAFNRYVRQSKSAVELVITKQLFPARSKLLPTEASAAHEIPTVAVVSDVLEKFLAHPSASASRTISLDVPAPDNRNVIVKNVIAILPGSDPKLKDTFVLLTAHYDHIGTTETGLPMANPASTQDPNDHIYNGANDDGSGTVSVIEIARALAKLNRHPRRSLVFITFFGEERGELGSAYYVEHPVLPLNKTVADVNLEQVGRTDELDRGKIVPQINTLSLTGFDYSDVTSCFLRAGSQVGVKVYKDAQASDDYFSQSDNAAFAQRGIPAHSISVAFDYPDYHGVRDEWQKIDYSNMARVDRAVAIALLYISNDVKPREWNIANPKTAPFREAQRKSGP